MKTTTLLAAASALLGMSLLASSGFAQVPKTGTGLPPPGLHDPGASSIAPAPAPAGSVPAAAMESRSVPALPSMQDAGAARDGRGERPPEVNVHQSGDDSVQEYSRNGRVYMVVVTPKNGITQTYMVDPQGRLVDEHGQKPVRPVMYKILEWGKSKPAAAASTPTPAGGGR